MANPFDILTKPEKNMDMLRDFGAILFIFSLTALVVTILNGNYNLIIGLIIFGGVLYSVGKYGEKKVK